MAHRPVHVHEGDAIEGRVILCECIQYSRPKRIPLTHRHTGWRLNLKQAYCVIERAYEYATTE